jgi:hypothetical protein
VLSGRGFAALEERIVDPFLGPKSVSDPSERCRYGKEDDGAGDQFVDVERAGDEGTAQMGSKSRGADPDEKQYGLNEPDCDGMKRHHGATLAALAAGVRDANHLDAARKRE